MILKFTSSLDKFWFALNTLISIFIGGGLGAIIRYLFSTLLSSKYLYYLNGIPLGTLLVNLIGCFLLGIISGAMPVNTTLKLALTTGFMGGLTTFSTFGLENARLLSEGQISKALFHVLLHAGLGIILSILGLSFGLNYAKK